MKALARRVERLERRHRPPGEGMPLVLFIGGNGEPEAALIIETGETLEREPGETVEAFERRAELMCKQVENISRPELR